MTGQNDTAVWSFVLNKRNHIRHIILILPNVIHIANCAARLTMAAQVKRHHFRTARLAQHLGAGVEGRAFGGNAVQ